MSGDFELTTRTTWGNLEDIGDPVYLEYFHGPTAVSSHDKCYEYEFSIRMHFCDRISGHTGSHAEVSNSTGLVLWAWGLWTEFDEEEERYLEEIEESSYLERMDPDLRDTWDSLAASVDNARCEISKARKEVDKIGESALSVPGNEELLRTVREIKRLLASVYDQLWDAEPEESDWR